MKILIIKKIVVISIIAACLFSLKQIEYDNFKFSKYINPLIWISIPFLLKYLLLDSSFRNVYKLFGAIFYIGILFFSFLFGILCGWSEDNYMYKNKKSKSTFIVCRRYDCYGTAEDCRLFKIIKITSHLKWATKFEEEMVDTTKWDKIPFGIIP